LKSSINFFFFLLSVLLFACNPPTPELSAAKNFFDLPAFFESELELLQKKKTALKKISYNSKVEEKQFPSDSLNFKAELKAFIDSDINRSSWLDKYSVDSILNTNGELVELNYKTDDKKLKTKSVNIKFSNQDVDQIEIQNQSGSFFSSSEQRLVYQTKKGYTIDNLQKIILFSDRVLKVQVSFLD